MSNKIVIKCENLVKNYKIGKDSIEILKGVNLEIAEGSWNAILGASGSGKTTLLNMLGVLERPTSGEITIAGECVNNLSGNSASYFRNHKIGFIFQSYQLLAELNILENIMLPAILAGTSRAVAKKKALALIEEVGLTARIKHHPNEMSGGEQQRCAIARSLINEPDIILADEPTGNLDKATGEEILNIFKALLSNNPKRTIIMITHSEQVAKLADNIYFLDNGLITNK